MIQSHVEQGTHTTVCQMEEEVFLILEVFLSNWMKKAVLKNIETNNS